MSACWYRPMACTRSPGERRPVEGRGCWLRRRIFCNVDELQAKQSSDNLRITSKTEEYGTVRVCWVLVACCEDQGCRHKKWGVKNKEPGVAQMHGKTPTAELFARHKHVRKDEQAGPKFSRIRRETPAHPRKQEKDRARNQYCSSQRPDSFAECIAATAQRRENTQQG